jgi:hypothetical protein
LPIIQLNPAYLTIFPRYYTSERLFHFFIMECELASDTEIKVTNTRRSASSGTDVPSPNPFASTLSGSAPEVGLVPVAPDDESPGETSWFAINYSDVGQFNQILQLAVGARGTKHKCLFGQRLSGAFNVAFCLKFEDGVEWIFKAPKNIESASTARLDSEIATLKFLQNVGNLPVPRVHDFSTSVKNPAGTPYVIMDKVPGVTLCDALWNGLGREGVHRVLEELAKMRKALQKQPMWGVGSLVLLWDEEGKYSDGICPDPKKSEVSYFLGSLINLWASNCPPGRYRGRTWREPLGYYLDQHALSLVAHGISGSHNELSDKWLAHLYLGSLLTSYVQESQNFYIAHTDLNIWNIMVDPSDGTVTGIIDWEFANALPPQAVEHYPSFMVNRDQFVKNYSSIFDDPSAELDNWRSHYAKQFDDPETVEFNNRIDVIILFEHLLRHLNDRPLMKIMQAVQALQAANALHSPLPKLPWDGHETPQTSTISTNGVPVTNLDNNQSSAIPNGTGSIPLNPTELQTFDKPITSVDGSTASQLPPLKSVMGTATQTTVKMVLDTMAQTDHSFPPNQGLPEKESVGAHARGKWLSTIADGCVRIYRWSKRPVLKKQFLCYRGMMDGVEMHES